MTYRADLQGLRAIAVALVIAHHYFPNQSSGGFLGVDVFFVVSGFIITSLLMRDREKTLGQFLLDFYARRIRRIIPSALLVILLSVAATFFFLGDITGVDTARDGRAATLFVANIHFNSLKIDYFTSGLPEPILQHFWSLAIEEQFYLLWPLIFFLFAKRIGNLIIFVSMVALSSFAFSVDQIDSATAYFSTFTRVWELAAGAFVALIGKSYANRSITFLAIAALLLFSISYSSETPFPSWPTLWVVLATVALIITSEGNQFLGSRPMVAIGDLSYTLYLVHWPMVQIYSIFKGVEPSLLEKMTLLMAVFVLSVIIHRVYENPIRFSSRLMGAPRATIVIGLSTLFSTALLLGMIGR